MDDSKEIIFIALSNSIIQYNELLETPSNDYTNEELELMKYTRDRMIQILDELTKDIAKEDDTPTPTPTWG